MTEQEITQIVENQRKYFLSGKTLDVDWRIEQLKQLKRGIIAYEQVFTNALYQDLGRSSTEAYLADIGPTIAEINETIAGLKKWSKPEMHYSGLMCFPSLTTKVYKMPYGVTLIMSPFNFPILLTLGVLCASMAGGNTAVIRTSAKSAACTKAIEKFISEYFPSDYITVVSGGHEVADYCLNQRFDKIFYTGSPNVAKHVMEMASKNLTPVALELGGENGNWCVIRKDANLKDAARKIAFFKAMNSGQICININQIAVAEEIADEFISELKKAFVKQLGQNPEYNKEYAKLIDEKAYRKCEKIVETYRDKVVFGGKGDNQTHRYSPTILYPMDINDEIVMQELFSPILPIVPYRDSEIDSVMNKILSREHPLALYLFTKDKEWANKEMSRQQYGGGCINEVCLQLMVKGVPFNGTGHSGMGAYHGEWGFKEFTHPSSVLNGSTHFNLSLREHPYSNKVKLSILKKLEK